jgi:hypothetical protein
MLGVTYKTAWFMAHRIREAMRPASLRHNEHHRASGCEYTTKAMGSSKSSKEP